MKVPPRHPHVLLAKADFAALARQRPLLTAEADAADSNDRVRCDPKLACGSHTTVTHSV
jgi:hypothetical protein